MGLLAFVLLAAKEECGCQGACAPALRCRRHQPSKVGCCCLRRWCPAGGEDLEAAEEEELLAAAEAAAGGAAGGAQVRFLGTVGCAWCQAPCLLGACWR